MRRAFVAVMVGVTAALLVGLASVSIAQGIDGSNGPAIQRMGISIGGIAGVATTVATLLLLGGTHRRIAIALYGGASLLAVAFLIWASGRVTPRPTLVLSASDRAELREFHDDDGVRGIEHPTLGFRLPHPTLALEPSEEIEGETRLVAAPNWAEAHEIWAFETRDHGVSVVIDLSRAEHADRASLDAFDDAVTGPLDRAGHTVTRQAPHGANGCLREDFTAQLSNGGHVDGVLFTFDEGARSLRLVVTVVTDGTGDWAQWIDDVSLACERGPVQN